MWCILNSVLVVALLGCEIIGPKYSNQYMNYLYFLYTNTNS